MADTPISKAVKFLKDYRTNRSKALNNEAVQRWATTPVDSLQDLVDVFDSTDANDQWSAEFEKIKSGTTPPGAELVQALRAAVNFLAGSRRDVRIQFAAGEDSSVRKSSDWDRYEYSRLAYNNYVMDLADKTMSGKLKL